MLSWSFQCYLLTCEGPAPPGKHRVDHSQLNQLARRRPADEHQPLDEKVNSYIPDISLCV